MVRPTRLKKDQQVTLIDGRTATTVDKLGEGGQGTVYKIKINGLSEEKALKWYFVEKIKDAEKFYKNLKENITSGSPSPAFIWPEALTAWTGSSDDTFGYVMRVIPDDCKSFSKYLLAQVGFKSFGALVDAALNIVKAFRDLHNAGYNYQDLNDGNFAINPLSGDVVICDNDNVMGHGQSSGIMGKARYMAPEVVRGEKTPDKVTDRFSLAVVLFMLMVGDHPLEGRKTDVPCLLSTHDKVFFGTDPVFIFDEANKDNRPVPGKHKNAINLWPLFPKFVQEAFKRSFSKESLLQSKGRLLEQQWLHLLVRLKVSIIKCPYCQSDLFVEHSGITSCPSCKKDVKTVGYFQFGKSRADVDILAPIYEGVSLFDYHMDDSSVDYRTVAATVQVKPGKFGLENKSKNNWTVTQADGSTRINKVGDTLLLSGGVTIDFGNGNTVKIIPN